VNLPAFLARRYIAGVAMDDAVGVAMKLNASGLLATIDNLGEDVLDAAEADRAVEEYIGLLDCIKEAGADSTISLKLTHLGLDVSEEVAERNAGRVMEKAATLDNFVRLDMEGSAHTQRIMDVFLRLHRRHPNSGIAVQSCLLMSASDVRLLIERGASVRLVKGAYKEPPGLAFQDKRDVDASFETLMKELLLKGVRPAIATHDERLIEEAVAFASMKGIPRDSFEFQMLLGIKRSLQRRLSSEGYRVRVYVPYGPDWLPYTLRRMRERKENLYFVLRNILD
jgi:proline dehydrogenase